MFKTEKCYIPVFQVNVKSRLEFHFQSNQKPNAQEITQVAMELQLEKEVRIFFYFPEFLLL